MSDHPDHHSVHHNSTDELNDEVPKVVNNHHRKPHLRINKNWLIIGLILLALPLTVGLVLVQQEIRSRASGGPVIARVEVSPGAIMTDDIDTHYPVGISALAYDTNGNPINHSAVTYEWSMSSTNTVGTLTRTQGPITEFKPYSYGCGQITVNALMIGATSRGTKSVTVAVGSPNGMPNCGGPTPTPFITPTPTPGNTRQQTYLKCDPRITLNDYVSKQIGATLVAGNGQVLSSKSISWTRAPGTSGYPLINPSVSFTGTTGEANTYVWMPDGFYGSGSNTVISEFFGDPNYYPSSCYTTVSYSISPTPTPIPVKTTTITAFQDAFVRSDKPATNYGYGGRLRADDSPRIISYLKFDVSPVIGKKIISAKLRLRVSTDAGSGSSDTFNLRSISLSAWNEGTVTYNNRPSLGTTVKSFTGKGDGATIDIDVKSLIGNTNRFSWAIATPGTNELILQSREAGTGKPQLIIQYQ